MIYSMILNSCINKVSAIQRMITTLAVRCHADNMLLSRLNKLHITMSAVSKGNIITEWGDNYDNRLKKSIADGNDGKLNGDNVDIFVTTNDIRMKKFFKKSSGRDVGTLYHLKTIIQRTSVNGNVKSRFKAHEEFALLVGKAYVLEAAMEHFGMDNMESIPTLNVPTEDINKSHHSRRLMEFNKSMDGFITMVCSSLSFNEVPDQSRVTVTIAGQDVQLPVENGNVHIKFQHLGQAITVLISLKTLKQNSVRVMLGGTAVTIMIKQGDELQNYILNYLQYYFVLLNFKDSIREGDIIRTSNILKIAIPFFFNHSPLSKYMVECIDFILKTEVLLPAKLSLQVRVASFVNPKGRQGKNKAADLQKENQVKEVKTLIRGLGANKTEQSVIKISAAAPVIKDIVQNFDSQIDFKEKSTSHKKRSEEEDLQCIIKVLRELRPFRTVPGRKLESFNDMKASVFHELYDKRGVLNEKIQQQFCMGHVRFF
ncbi:uncharacterized protein LOC128551493 [Mercenaria mercenaria]|uniref:uncharacterized protein LOC128551493 n=1 Tax=Mercenaria mercenaria TaxID=6596 RepID=UPI00234E7322|nr:uncharacterized protein LOC128551493 [Mercenaria mercenaria]